MNNTNLFPKNLPEHILCYCQNCNTDEEVLSKLCGDKQNLFTFFAAAINDSWYKEKKDFFDQMIVVIQKINIQNRLKNDSINKIIGIFNAVHADTRIKLANLFETTLTEKNIIDQLTFAKKLDSKELQERCFKFLEEQIGIKCSLNGFNKIKIEIDEGLKNGLNINLISLLYSLTSINSLEIEFTATGNEKNDQIEFLLNKFDKNISKIDLKMCGDKIDDVFTKKILARCINLRNIAISSSKINDASLKNLPFLKNLQSIDFSMCLALRKLPDFRVRSGFASILELTGITSWNTGLTSINLSGCENLIELDLAKHPNLTEITLSNCKKLPQINFSELKKLTEININNITNSTKISGLQNQKNLIVLNLTKILGFEELNLSKMDVLKKITLKECSDLKYVTLSSLINLAEADFSLCVNLQQLQVKNVKNLAKLNLHRCYKVQNLQWNELTAISDLDLAYCKEILQLDLKQLQSLTALYLTGCENLTNLYLYNELKTLKTLHVSGCEKLLELPWEIMIEFTELDLSGCNNLAFKGDLTKFKRIQKINFSGCKKIQTLDLWDLPLTELNLSECINLRELFLSRISNLENVILLGCENLEKVRFLKLINLIRVDFGESKKLNQIEVNDCANLEQFLDLQNFQNLTELNLSKYGGLTKLNLSNIVGLKKISIRECPNLLIASFNGLYGLEEVNITSCENLREIVLINTANLKKFILQMCKKIKQLDLSWLKNITDINLSGCDNIEYLLLFWGIKNLKILNLAGCGKIPELKWNSFKSLVQLDLSECNNLILTSDFAKLKNLRELKLSSLKDIQKLDLKEMPSLIKLYIDHCSNLKELCLANSIILEEIILSGCTELIKINLSGLRKLNKIDLNDCFKLTNEAKASAFLSLIEEEPSKPWSLLQCFNLNDTDIIVDYLLANKSINIINIFHLLKQVLSKKALERIVVDIISEKYFNLFFENLNGNLSEEKLSDKEISILKILKKTFPYIFNSKAVLLQTAIENEEIKLKDFPDIDVGDLITLFETINFDDKDKPSYISNLSDDGKKVNENHIKNGLDSLIFYIKNKTVFIGTPTDATDRKKWYEDLEKIIINVIELMQKSEDKILISMELCRLGVAGKHCGMRWLAEAKDAYKALSNMIDLNSENGLKQKVANWLDYYKEGIVHELVLKYSPITGEDYQPHIINRVIKVLTDSNIAAFPKHMLMYLNDHLAPQSISEDQIKTDFKTFITLNKVAYYLKGKIEEDVAAHPNTITLFRDALKDYLEDKGSKRHPEVIAKLKNLNIQLDSKKLELGRNEIEYRENILRIAIKIHNSSYKNEKKMIGTNLKALQNLQQAKQLLESIISSISSKKNSLPSIVNEKLFKKLAKLIKAKASPIEIIKYGQEAAANWLQQQKDELLDEIISRKYLIEKDDGHTYKFTWPGVFAILHQIDIMET